MDKYLENIKRNIQLIKKSATGDKTLKELLHQECFPLSTTPNIKTHDVIYALVEHNKDNMGYFYLTGRSLFRSARGNQYIVVAYHYNANNIDAVAIQNREAPSITKA